MALDGQQRISQHKRSKEILRDKDFLQGVIRGDEDIPLLAPGYFQIVGHWPASAGTAISISGLILIAIGWVEIHQAKGLVTEGIYRYMRHPQYTGIILFTFGWVLHWPSFVTLILWPILIAAYVWLAREEERQALEEFGEDYIEYTKRTKRFIPFVI